MKELRSLLDANSNEHGRRTVNFAASYTHGEAAVACAASFLAITKADPKGRSFSKRRRNEQIMLWIVGLGNPGKQYSQTRHNIGFMAIDELANRWNIDVSRSKGRALIGEGRVGDKKVYLIKPMTYMNLSGEAVREFMDYYKAPLESGVVVYDDLDTTLGQIRLRYKGSAGGHNGIKSVIAHVGTEQFNRMRVGISRPEPGLNIVDYVLSPFTHQERSQLPAILDKSCDALEYMLETPFETVMAKFNGA